MAMQRKPAPTGRENVDVFISGASAETPEAEEHKRKHKRLQPPAPLQPRRRFEACYKRETYYVREELVEEINRRSAAVGKGEKTRIVNQALAEFLDRGQETE